MSESKGALRINLRTGEVEIPADMENIPQILEQIGKLMDRTVDSQPGREGRTVASSEALSQRPVSSSRKKGTTLKGGATSSVRNGRIGGFEPVDLGLAEDAERELRAFYTEKAPQEQALQVAVVLFKAEKLLNRKTFTYNEIYTLLRLAGEKDLPKALDVLFSNLIKDNWAFRDESGQLGLKYLARDEVEKIEAP